MKLAIFTQYRENYSDTDTPCWKNKFGSTYYVSNLTDDQIAKINAEGIPTLTKLIEWGGEGSTNEIAGYRIVEDSAEICEPWENAWELSYFGGRWRARRVIDNTGEYGGQFRHQIATKIEGYDMLEAAGRHNYYAIYDMVTGEKGLTESQLRDYVSALSED